ncbi:MAG: FAD-dependent oxidoreductase, partial [Chloroflexota bacterium]|nr:FAD-dependent oxidoreductase [Chloroflexota bacterium]
THEPAHSTQYAAAVKKAVSIPVMTVGRLYARLAERILQEGKADLICIGRGLIAGPDFAVKNAQGKGDDVMPCIACDNCRDHVVYRQEWMRCAVNPVAGRERELAFRPAAASKQVVVVGGGPAGMEAARIAAQRGHRVTLFEKDTQLGGQLLQAAAPPNKVGIPVLTKFLVNQLKKLEVKVELGKAVTAQDILASKPQAVIVATGVKLTMPQIQGLDRAKVVTAGDVLLGKAQVGQRVVVIGGELVGCETADVLSEQGKKVTVTRRGPRMAEKMQPHLRSLLLHRLAAKGVTLLTGVKYEEVTPQGLKITHEGKTSLVEADTIVIAAGAQPDTSLYQALQGKVPELHLVGDAMAPRKIESAMEEGYRAGLTV